jgi:hypothetical protein
MDFTPSGATMARSAAFRGPMPVLKFKRLPARYASLLMPFILSLLMSAIVSFIATLKTAGLTPGLVGVWLGAWQVSWLIAFPTLLVMLPIVRWIVAQLVEPVAPQQ